MRWSYNGHYSSFPSWQHGFNPRSPLCVFTYVHTTKEECEREPHMSVPRDESRSKQVMRSDIIS